MFAVVDSSVIAVVHILLSISQIRVVSVFTPLLPGGGLAATLDTKGVEKPLHK